MTVPLLLLFLQASAYQSGIQAYSEHRFAEAIPFFEKAAAGGSQALVARFMLGNSCLQAHQDEKAVQAFAALFEVPADSAAAHLLTAGMMQRAAMMPDARQHAGRALEIDPHIPQAHLILGEAALSRGDGAQAITEFQKEIEVDPGFFMAYYRLGAAYESRGAWDDAIPVLERAIWLNPNHSGPYTLIGKAYLKRGDVDDAEGALRHALQMDPQDQAVRQLLEQTKAHAEPAAGSGRPAPSPAYAQGLESYRRRDYAAAAKSLAEAVPQMPASSPQYREALQVVGRSEYLAGHIPAAIPWLEKARAAGARNNELFFMLGNCYLQARQVAKARAEFAGLYGVPDASAAARLFTAHMLMRLEFEDDAEAELEAALRLDPKLPETHYMLGEIAIYRAQIDRAVDELKHEIALNPAFARAFYRLGDAYTRREDWEHAVPPLQRAVWLDPTYSGPYILLGKAYLKKGDLTEAEHMLRRALQMDPRNASAHYLLGRTLIQSGHAEEGRKLLERWKELQ
ncbi:MAG TPA: tetratricopeptide repeat protein [Bryobacteraceae bacterium]|nr:tetratricopeptide repeat protein [Bryobacteraceae bacterium]